jgi:hypothetical protein
MATSPLVFANICTNKLATDDEVGGQMAANSDDFSRALALIA